MDKFLDACCSIQRRYPTISPTSLTILAVASQQLCASRRRPAVGAAGTVSQLVVGGHMIDFPACLDYTKTRPGQPINL
jgi:hypothetical protein